MKLNRPLQKTNHRRPAKPGRYKVRTLGVAAGLDPAEPSYAFDDFFGGGVGGGVGGPAAVAGEGEELGAAWVENFCYRGAGGCGAVGGHDRAGDTVGHAVVKAGFDQDKLDVMGRGALVELGEE